MTQQLGMLMPTIGLYTPDAVHSRRHTPEATPTRQSGQYDIGDDFSRLNLSTPQSHGYVPSMTPHNASLARMPAPFAMGHMYSPQPPYLGSMSPFSPTGFSPFARGPAPFSPIAHQHGFDRHFHEMSPSYPGTPYSPYPYGGRGFSRPSPGRHFNPERDYSPRGGMSHRRRGSSNPAAGQHNQVDPEKINAGTDVRTTVSPFYSQNQNSTDHSAGHVEKHSKQGQPGRVEGNRRFVKLRQV